jgi:hypothetical protein
VNIVDAQAAICRDWIEATRLFDAGRITREEYDLAREACRDDAESWAREYDPLFGASAARRAQAWAAPIQLGAVGCSLGPASSRPTPELSQVLPKIPPPHEWAQTVAFGPRSYNEMYTGGRFKVDRKSASIMPGAHPSRLTR